MKKFASRKLVMTVFGVVAATYLAKNPNETSAKAIDLIGTILLTYIGGQSVVDATAAFRGQEK